MSFIAPAPTETITVNAKALHCLLSALRGPSHHLRELQVIANGSIAGLFGEEESTNPIGTLVKTMTEWHEAKRAGQVDKAPEPKPVEEPAKVKAKTLFNDCRIEQEAFEKRAAFNKMDMTQHPLHYLFLSSATADARDWWNAGRDHAIERMEAAFSDGMPDEPQKLIAKGWIDQAMGEVAVYDGLINIHTLSTARQLPDGTHRLYLHPRAEVQLIAKDKA